MTAVVVTQGKVKLQKERSTFIYRSHAGSWEQQIYLSGRGAEGRGGEAGHYPPSIHVFHFAREIFEDLVLGIRVFFVLFF